MESTESDGETSSNHDLEEGEVVSEEILEASESQILEDSSTVWTTNEDFQIFSASSVFGGMQFRGNFQMTFTLDYGADPGHQTELIEDVPAGISNLNVPIHIRQRQTAVTLTPTQTFSIGSWMLSHVTDASQPEIQDLISDHTNLQFGESEVVDTIIDKEDFEDDEIERIEELLNTSEGKQRLKNRFSEVMKELAKEEKNNE